MPADPERRGATVEAGPAWVLDPALAADERADLIVWGRLPDSVSPLAAALRSAIARELGLVRLGRRVPQPLHIAAVHRLRPHQLSRGLRGALRAAIRSGALVELTSMAPGERVLDAVAVAAGCRLLSDEVYSGSGGTLIVRVALADAAQGVLRLARAGTPGDPAGLGNTLEQLERIGVALAPRLLRRGQTAEASWTLEQALPGGRPTRLSGALAGQVGDALAGLPRAAGGPLALAEDLDEIAASVTSRAVRVRRLGDDVATAVSDLPAVLRHGDMWLENILVDRGRLSGFVDWDAAHPAGVPGADLLQLVATEQRRRARRPLGAAFLSSPWRSEAFERVSAGYWRAVRIEPNARLLEMAGLAWWAVEIRWTLTRLPHRATDEQWLAANVDPVLAARDAGQPLAAPWPGSDGLGDGGSGP
jgi:Ser/Thr protein kinase RdoA (MazF antagonist)